MRKIFEKSLKKRLTKIVKKIKVVYVEVAGGNIGSRENIKPNGADLWSEFCKENN